MCVLVGFLLAGCGSTTPTAAHHAVTTGVSDARAESVPTVSAPQYPSAPSAIGAVEVAHVCGLVSTSKIDSTLGGRYLPIVRPGEVNGYVPSSLIATYASRSNVHRVEPAISIRALATCAWEDKTSYLAGGKIHPEMQYELETYSSPVAEAVYLKAGMDASPGLEHLSGIGQWATYGPLDGELSAAVGNQILRIGNDYGGILDHRTTFKSAYSVLAASIIDQLH